MEAEEIVLTSNGINDIVTSAGAAEVGQGQARQDEEHQKRPETASTSSDGPNNVEQGLSSGSDSTTNPDTMTSSAATAGAPKDSINGSEPESNKNNSNNVNNEDSTFECNICLDTARNAVISMCGHLFCWSCLHQWLETRPNKQVCPVCKSAIGRDKVIPLYGRNGDQKDPRDSAPPRPQGQRSEPTNTVFSSFNMAGIGGENGFQFSFGIGAFPFALFATAFNFGERRPPPPAQWTQQYEAERTLHNTFICVAVLFMVWLLLA